MDSLEHGMRQIIGRYFRKKIDRHSISNMSRMLGSQIQMLTCEEHRAEPPGPATDHSSQGNSQDDVHVCISS